MDIDITKTGDEVFMTLDGSIDIPGAELLKRNLNTVLEYYGDTKKLTMDFKQVDFIGSSGIGKLLLFYQKFSAMGGQIWVINANPEIAGLFKDIHVDRMFHI
jgi:anti-anti-sigma factor